MPAAKVNGFFVTGGRFHDTDFARLELLKLLTEKPNIRPKTGNDYCEASRVFRRRFHLSHATISRLSVAA